MGWKKWGWILPFCMMLAGCGVQDAAAGVGEAGNAAQEQTESSLEIPGEQESQESSGEDSAQEQTDGQEQPG
ncbi:MAG: hypothetical protein K2H45_14270, partial [Acetatifactor sp.]|nr:hypothetical protein [Acetatifactor sp.]